MAAREELPGGNIRASDDDRNRVAEELRIHCQDGRITVEELETRLEQAMSARTIHDLAEVVADLPPIRTATEPAGARHPVAVGPPGIHPFTRRIIVPAGLERTREVALDQIAPVLGSFGYALDHTSARTLEFGRDERPPAAIAVAILFFPIGLLALLVRRELRIVITLESHGTGETTMIVHGRAPQKVRRAFAQLSFS